MPDGHKTEQTEYLELQLYQIELGRKKGLDVSVYESPEYDWFQMEQIRLGMESGVDIAIYARPEVHFDRMREIRLSLESGLTGAVYLDHPAGVIREIRKAVKANVDLLPYVSAGYGDEQLAEIRVALGKKVRELDQYLNPVFRGVAIREIRIGLQEGLDVSVYANLEFDWQQMREIRRGMESRIDYMIYAKPLYDWHQMKEIRIGLELGLDVGTYKSLMYPWREMRKRRMHLVEYGNIPQETEQIKGKKSDQFLVSIRENDMEAYLTVYAGDSVVTESEILETLHQNGVVNGIRDEIVKGVAEGRYEKESVLIATGQIPKSGPDGYYEFFFRTHLDHKPIVLENGEVDYHNIQWFESVKNGQKLAVYHPAEMGQEGYTVTGRVIPAKKGRDEQMLNGSGFVLGPDKKSYYSSVAGIVSLENNTLIVSPQLTVETVTLATGNLSFNGSLHITGNVEDGVTVSADEDIIVDGFIGAAHISCGGKLVVRQGINSNGKGTVWAEKGISSRSLDSVRIKSNGEIQANYCLNSEIHTRGRIELTKSVVGGQILSEQGISLRNAGNPAGAVTKVVLDPGITVRKELLEKTTAMAEIRNQIGSLKKSQRILQQKYPPEIRNADPLYLKVEKSLFDLEQRYEEVAQEASALETKLEWIRKAKVEIDGTAYPGTRVYIGKKFWDADGSSNIVLRAPEGDEVTVKNK